MNIQALFDSASAAAQRGEHAAAAGGYETFLREIQGGRWNISRADARTSTRAAAFNLAQSLNRISRFTRALEAVDMGLSCGPTPVGRAIALAAKGEAMCGLGRMVDGKAAFDEAAAAHPLIGRLNSADSMSRLASEDLLSTARQWVESALQSYAPSMDPRRLAEANTILARLARRRGDTAAARKFVSTALAHDPSFSDAQFESDALRDSTAGD